MADAAVVHIGENSPEKIALDLTNHIARMEGYVLYRPGSGDRDKCADRKWLLDTYAECLEAALGRRGL